jgi:ferredoxin--NADP+ reductase
MHTVIDTAQLSPNVTRLVIEAPRIAEIRRPGQFVIVHRAPGAERIPLTIADADPERGTITLVIQAVGKSTEDLVALRPGDAIADVAGPLGKATELLDHGRAVCVGGGVGTAVVHPIALGLAALGVEVISVIGGRSKEWVIFEDELRRAGRVITCTDDGSYGRHGFVTDALREVIEAGGVDAVYAVGPVPMMRAVAELTRPYGVRTFASLNAIMLDGTGMCGGCRVAVGGKTVYACVDGPEFDAHQVDFRELADRLGTYRDFEAHALDVARKRRAEAADAADSAGSANAAGSAPIHAPEGSCLIPGIATAAERQEAAAVAGEPRA